MNFSSWREIEEIIKEVLDKQELIKAEVVKAPGIIPVNKLRELIRIKEAMTQLNADFEQIKEALNTLSDLQGVEKDAERVKQKFSEMYKNFQQLKKELKAQFYGLEKPEQIKGLTQEEIDELDWEEF